MKSIRRSFRLACFFCFSIIISFSSSAEIVTLSKEESENITIEINKKMNSMMADARVKAEQGDPEAMNLLGNLMGPTQGFYWIRKSAESGSPLGQKNSSYRYGSGMGTPKNIKLAYAWSAVAAANGEKSAASLRDLYMEMLTPEGLEEAEDIAVSLYEKYGNAKHIR